MNLHVSEVVVPASHPALPGHFPGRPIVPAAWILTLVAEACRDAFGGALISGVVHARFRAPWLPGVPVRIELARHDDGGIAFTCADAAGRIADGLLTGGRK